MTGVAVATARSVIDQRLPHQQGFHKWYVALALCAGHAVSLADRFVMVLVSEPVRAAMDLSDLQLGLLQGTGFALLYCAFALPLGSIADTFNRRNLIAFGVTFWSLATVAAAFTNSFETLFLTRVLVGMGEACLIPAAMSLLTSYFPRDKLARGTAIYGVGANIGHAIAFIGGGAVLANLNAAGGLTLPGGQVLAPWQGVFMSAGLIAVPVLLLLAFVREPARPGGSVKPSVSSQLAIMREGAAYILRNIRSYMPFLVIAAATAASGYALNSWSTSLFVRLHGATPADAGKYVGIIGLLAGPVGTLLGGVVLDKLQSAGVRAAPLVLMGWAAACMILFVSGFVFSSGSIWPFVFFVLFTTQSFFMLPSTYVGMQLITPDGVRGIAASFNMMFYTLCGLGVGPTLVGVVSDQLGGNAMLGEAVLFVEIIAGAVIIAIALTARGSYHARAAQCSQTDEHRG